MKVIVLSGKKYDPYPRVEKEINSLLSMARLDVKVVAWDKNEKYKERISKQNFSNGTVDVVRFGIPVLWGGGMRKSLLATIKYELQISNWLVKHRKEYDCIHSIGLISGLPSLFIKKLFKKKMVYDIADYYADLRANIPLITKIFRFLENTIINNADATIICSEKRREQIKGTKPKRLYVVHNSPSKDQLKQSNARERVCLSDSTLPKVVYVGNLIEDRYIKTLLEIAAETKEFELHIGGFGVLEQMVASYAEKIDNIYFYGKMQYTDVLKLESECDILLALYDPNIPNHKYAAPNKFYEALLLGKPLIMFENTGMDDIITKNDIGYVVKFDKNELKNGILHLIHSRDRWNEMSNKAKRLYEKEFSWDIMEKRLFRLYEEIKNV